MRKLPILFALFFSILSAHGQEADPQFMEAVLAKADAAMAAGDFKRYHDVFAASAAEAQERFGPGSMEHALMLDYLADVQKNLGDYPGAEASLVTVLEIFHRKNLDDHYHVAKAMGQLGFTRFRLGKYETVDSLLLGARQRFADLGMQRSLEQANVCSSLGAVYQARGFFLKAEAMHREALDIAPNTEPYDESVYAVLANNLAVFYAKLQRAAEAIRYFDSSLAIKEKQFGKEHQQYLYTLKNKGRMLADVGRFSEAEVLLKQALDVSRKTLPPNHVRLADYCSALALLYKTTGNCAEAIRLHEENLQLLKNAYGEGYPGYLSGRSDLAVVYHDCGRTAEALDLLQQVIAAKPGDAYAHTLLGRIRQDAGAYDLARPLLEKGAGLGAALLGTDHPSYHPVYAEALIRQELLENRPDAALALLDSVRQPVLEAYGERHAYMISVETQYGVAWQLKGDPLRALHHFRTAFAAMQYNLLDNLRYFSTEEREQFAGTFERYRAAFLGAARAFPADPGISAFLYDLTLFQKELLAGFDRRMLADGQQDADPLFQDYTAVRRMIARQWTLPLHERLDLPELERRRADLEKQLSGKSGFSPATAQTLRWQQLQQRLGSGEAAVEWLVLPAGDTACYAALVLRPDAPGPALVVLPPTAQIDALFASRGSRGLLYATRTYSGDALYRSLWQPLEAALAGVRRVYMAPTGALHLLNFNALPTAPDGPLLAEKYELVRVTTTARLLDPEFGKGLDQPFSALLAGGLDYESASRQTAVSGDMASNAGAALWRGGGSVREWAALPHTLPEAERIAALLREKGGQATLLSGADGSEAAVRALCAAAPPRMLHFATHGFFFERNTADAGSLGLAAAENPMYRSGLILSGANPAWRGESGSGLDDGILTADEIALLPLRNTALVVLSACETGLGDVHDDEGVYGLQRAFRLAGAQSLVMSLWRVPDAQTRQFMEQFYAALIEQGQVRQAFNQARQQMRREFGNPYYWAGFVLLE